MTEVITSTANDQIKRLRSLRDKKGRRQHNLFLAEGLRVCAEAADAGRLPEVLAFTDSHAGHPRVAALAAATAAAGGRVLATTAQVMEKLADKDNPGVVIGAFRPAERTLVSLDRHAARAWVVAEGLKDPGNLGTMLRACDGAGAGGVILLDQSCDPHSVEAVRASMGAVFTVPVVRTAWAEFIAWLRAGDGTLIGAVLGPDTVDWRVATYPPPTFLLMGNEQSGLPAAYAAACDTRVRIPMLGRADSLNVAVATALLLYRTVPA